MFIEFPFKSFHSIHPLFDFPITIQPALDELLQIISSYNILFFIFTFFLIGWYIEPPVFPQQLPFNTV